MTLMKTLTLKTLLLWLSLFGLAACSQDPSFKLPSHTQIVATSTTQGEYLGSPSITKHQGVYYISHDYYGGTVMNRSTIYRSTDLKKWAKISDVNDIYWATLFSHNGYLYMYGTGAEYYNVVIKRSIDGISWEHFQLLSGGYHTSTMKPYIVGNIAYKMYETFGAITPRNKWRNTIIGVNLKTMETTISNGIPANDNEQTIEGNIVENGSNELQALIRKNCGTTNEGISADYKLSTNTLHLNGFTPLPGSGSKFHLVQHPVTKKYWLATNTGADCDGNRNTLDIYQSTDLKKWQLYKTVLQHPNADNYAFQYPSFIIDKNTLLIVTRSAINQHETKLSWHQANNILLSKIPLP